MLLNRLRRFKLGTFDERSRVRHWVGGRDAAVARGGVHGGRLGVRSKLGMSQRETIGLGKGAVETIPQVSGMAAEKFPSCVANFHVAFDFVRRKRFELVHVRIRTFQSWHSTCLSHAGVVSQFEEGGVE